MKDIKLKRNPREIAILLFSSWNWIWAEENAHLVLDKKYSRYSEGESKIRPIFGRTWTTESYKAKLGIPSIEAERWQAAATSSKRNKKLTRFRQLLNERLEWNGTSLLIPTKVSEADSSRNHPIILNPIAFVMLENPGRKLSVDMTTNARRRWPTIGSLTTRKMLKKSERNRSCLNSDLATLTAIDKIKLTAPVAAMDIG